MGRLAPFLALVAIGTAWGTTTPLMKVAVATGHQPFGIMLWQMLVSAALLALILRLRGRLPLPLGPADLRLYAMVAAFGMVLPHFFSYTAIARLPAGVMSIVISMVPLFALPIALALGLERFRPVRLAGLVMGAVAIVLLMAPQASLPAGAAAAFVAVAALTPLCYAIEGAYVSGWGSRVAGPMQTLLGGTLMALFVVVPATVLTGQSIDPFAPWGLAEAAVVTVGVVSTLAYSGFVALLRATGAVFAAQVSYLVTGSGVIWAMMFLGERYSGWVWGALLLMFAGLFLVQPRPAPSKVRRMAGAPRA